MSERRPNPAIPADQRCASCSGWGGHIIHRGGDNYEDSQKCWGCNGSGANSDEGEKT